jgi:hypothetical protein
LAFRFFALVMLLRYRAWLDGRVPIPECGGKFDF